ncbi:Mss4-like protein [Xylaria palmicola]|nr:Mss4-like protein [Xylaria palmicola]
MATRKEEEVVVVEQHGEAEDTVELVAHCLCQAQRFTARVPRSSLPLEAIYCHCTSCRRLTGALYSTYVPWPGDAAAAVRASSLRRLAFSDAIATLFCGVCGSAMFAERLRAADDDDSAPPSYGVQTGVLTNIDVPGLVNITHHIFLGDTLDGGASPWLCDANGDGTRPRLWRGHRGQSEELSGAAQHHWPAAAAAAAARGGGGGLPPEIPIRCYCGGVDLVLRRPVAAFAAVERAALPWFVDPATNKLHGGFDACDSCRLASGSDIFHWTFVLLRHLAFPASSSSGGAHPHPHPRLHQTEEEEEAQQAATAAFPGSTTELKNAALGADRDPRWGTLTCYESSPDVQRYFCGRCSATVFYATDGRPDMVDLAIGLLHTEEDGGGGGGARAESLVSWDFGGKVGWRQDVAGGWRQGFVESIEAAAERWRIERGYPKSWRRIQREEAAQ